MSKLSTRDQIKYLAEQSLEKFINLVHPNRVLGAVHLELISWWTREDAYSHQLTLLPRDHMKSTLIAYRVAWEITKNPALRVLYISSTSTLAVKQLKFLKDILTSDIYKFYWPDMVNTDEAKREKWTETEIAVDHPNRRAENIRDPSIMTAGLSTSITGLHFDITVLDDVVVRENAYTEEGRAKVETLYSLLASIESTDARQWIVGTRYHPQDLYGVVAEKTYDIFDENGEVTDERHLYEVFQREVEDRGDGHGQFLWPRQQRKDGRWFGFDENILAKKKAQYLDRIQFRAQYYNDPNDSETAGIDRSKFQYYDRRHLRRFDGKWYIGNARLNVFASIDLAYTLGRRSDYTAVVVVGVTGDHQYYILDIDRFRTNKISDYFASILALHQKWDFRVLIAEVTAGQSIIINDLKNNYIKAHGLALSIKDEKPSRWQGSKEERIELVLQPRYDNMQIWHYQGGHCQTLEEELVLQNPPHDDIKDCLATCISRAQAPTGNASSFNSRAIPGITTRSTTYYGSRFGGVH